MASYYNEIDPFAAAWLRELIKAGLIADGEVDERDIRDVQAADVRGFTQCHWFAGIGGWSYALRLAGWLDDRPAWTGSCPCQSFSSATRGRAVAPDMRPEFTRLIAHARPRIVFGEQVVSREWLDGFCADVEAVGYEVGATVLPAVAFGFDHARPRLYFACHTNRHRQSDVPVDGKVDRVPRRRSDARRMVPADGLSRDVVALSGFGNAIVPAVAAEVVRAYMELCSERATTAREGSGT